MKKTRLKINKCQVKNLEKCTDEISTDGIHPPLFCSHTWTKCVPISVKLYFINDTQIHYYDMLLNDNLMMFFFFIIPIL